MKSQKKDINGRQSNGESGFEAARKAAAARVEDTARRALQQKEEAFAKCRGAELPEKAAKESREKEQRRAEVYAINAVLRYGWHPHTIDCSTAPSTIAETFHGDYGGLRCFR